MELFSPKQIAQATGSSTASLISKKIFGECSRYRADLMASRFGTPVVFFFDAEQTCPTTKGPKQIAQFDTVAQANEYAQGLR